jgi:tripartite-type tricarboxylate transporter receptor subunit TctC
MPKRTSVITAGLAAAAMLGAPAWADFPTQPVRIVVPFAAGTTTDLVARQLGAGMEAVLGQPFVYENRAGAGGSVGTHEVVTARPDGYTLSMGTVGTLAINKSIFPDLPYDPEEDVTPIAMVGYTPTLLVVSAESEFETLDDLVSAAQDEGRDGVTFASAGNGTSGHLAGELVRTRSEGNMIHVPFGSGAEGLTAVMSQEVDFMFYHPVAALPYLEAGTLRALGVSGLEPSSVAPDVAPIAETFEGFDLVAWFLLAGPRDLPDDVARTLHDAARESLASDAVQEHFATNGIEFEDMEFDALPGFISEQVVVWGEIAEDAQAQLD